MLYVQIHPICKAYNSLLFFCLACVGVEKIHALDNRSLQTRAFSYQNLNHTKK